MILMSMSVGRALYRSAARHLSTHRGRDGHEPQAQPPCPIDGPQPCPQRYSRDVSASRRGKLGPLRCRCAACSDMKVCVEEGTL
jgi:hypothetical protein